MKPFHFMILVFALVISGCGSLADANRPRLERDAASSYSADFHLQFIGAKNWSYQLKTRKSTTQREISLHIEGIAKAQNPGDIRLVTDNKTTWMTGEGTDQQCVQFPNGQGMDPTFIYPESLVTLTAVESALKLVGEEPLSGFTVLHFRAVGVASGPWRNATIDIWQEKGSGMLRQFNMIATGDDPFFAAGSGKLAASYKADPLGSDAINPVTGCEVSVPLPEAISRFVRLPGMASFDSKSSIDELVKFYQTALPGQNWVEKEAPVQGKEGTVLSYQRNAESVEIQIDLNPAGGCTVKLLFSQQP